MRRIASDDYDYDHAYDHDNHNHNHNDGGFADNVIKHIDEQFVDNHGRHAWFPHDDDQDHHGGRGRARRQH